MSNHTDQFRNSQLKKNIYATRYTLGTESDDEKIRTRTLQGTSLTTTINSSRFPKSIAINISCFFPDIANNVFSSSVAGIYLRIIRYTVWFALSQTANHADNTIHGSRIRRRQAHRLPKWKRLLRILRAAHFARTIVLGS